MNISEQIELDESAVQHLGAVVDAGGQRTRSDQSGSQATL
jgi:hypothetical protein